MRLRSWNNDESCLSFIRTYINTKKWRRCKSCFTKPPRYLIRSTLLIPDMGNDYVTTARLKYSSEICNMKNMQIEKMCDFKSTKERELLPAWRAESLEAHGGVEQHYCTGQERFPGNDVDVGVVALIWQQVTQWLHLIQLRLQKLSRQKWLKKEIRKNSRSGQQ